MKEQHTHFHLSVFLLVLLCIMALSPYTPAVQASTLTVLATGTLTVSVIHSADAFNSIDRSMGAGILVGALQGGIAKKFCSTNSVSNCTMVLPYGYYNLTAYPSQSPPLFFHWICGGSVGVDAPTRASVVRCRLSL